MKKFDFSTGATKLQTAFDALSQDWQETTETWRDDVSRKYAERHLDPIGPIIHSAIDAIGRIGAVVRRIERDCGDQ